MVEAEAVPCGKVQLVLSVHAVHLVLKVSLQEWYGVILLSLSSLSLSLSRCVRDLHVFGTCVWYMCLVSHVRVGGDEVVSCNATYVKGRERCYMYPRFRSAKNQKQGQIRI